MSDIHKITDLRGVGPALAEKLKRLNVHQPDDLLFLLPQRYEDRTRISSIGSLRPGFRGVIEAVVELTEVVFRRRRTMLCQISDGTGILTLRFFYFSKAQQKTLARGQKLRCYGETRSCPGGLEMIHPEYQLLRDSEQAPLEQQLTPVYPTTEGLQQFRLRNLVDQALTKHIYALPELLPKQLLLEAELPGLQEALRCLHSPPADIELSELLDGKHPSQRRLALEEILAHHLSMRKIKQANDKEPGLAVKTDETLLKQFLDSLSFTLTGDQSKVLEDINNDLTRPHPMMRLVQGDVGCGKTVVAAAAALSVISAGYQVAIMAPTELLAEQHRDNFQKWLEPLGIVVAWLTGSLTAKARRQTYNGIAAGHAQLIVGTHALFQEAVQYDQLGLVIVDEQHRFGVEQRLSLIEKSGSGRQRPHQLVMTATPIPRTLAMTLYADLDTSVIKELPPGRTPVTTVAISEQRRGEVVARIREACKTGQRAYWVCPLIEDSETLDYSAAESTFAMLQETLPELQIGLIHGRMKAAEKERTMKAFAEGKLSLLVATTVIEVGVDVPEATLMVIENAERMGLSQLHQLRGRVGRGADKSACVLMYKQPLSQVAHKRLDVMRDTNDGFVVAQQDLELRGPGEVLGKRQTGAMQLRVADLVRDADLLPAVQEAANIVLKQDDNTAQAIMDRWIGSDQNFVKV
ncbi:MAG: ATP-dependent DNA helicase RecG [Gammaproteobacteria bacterium]|nr:ATP-dependent DNA helicase RecG [Gammaproteobacteria bacterium]